MGITRLVAYFAELPEVPPAHEHGFKGHSLEKRISGLGTQSGSARVQDIPRSRSRTHAGGLAARQVMEPCRTPSMRWRSRPELSKTVASSASRSADGACAKLRTH